MSRTVSLPLKSMAPEPSIARAGLNGIPFTGSPESVAQGPHSARAMLSSAASRALESISSRAPLSSVPVAGSPESVAQGPSSARAPLNTTASLLNESVPQGPGFARAASSSTPFAASPESLAVSSSTASPESVALGQCSGPAAPNTAFVQLPFDS
eukprot:CAMPEP_0183478070 /NCGR_PEP_ID=MMETSP0370-20130417/169264_1 /TAXON_ID=268820 /ORGANISM="Peridinium aciculiferum, Strain PAER-2" /LENGTH=154 /DNA_ID=CAMNT_0025671009 /DNA_START=27 /DNA_END=488 /DNA_ORIENTATION=-